MFFRTPYASAESREVFEMVKALGDKGLGFIQKNHVRFTRKFL